MANTEGKWEDIHDIERLRVGDEVEFVRTSDHSEFKYWGEVLNITDYSVHVSGDWHLVESSLEPTGYNTVSLRRKVRPFIWPTNLGAVVKCPDWDGNGKEAHFVRVRHDGVGNWVHSETGNFYAEWELELLGKDLHAIGLAEFE